MTEKTENKYYKKVNEEIENIKKQEQKDPLYLVHKYTKKMPATIVNYAENLAPRLTLNFDKGEHVCEVGYDRYINGFNGYCYVHTLAEYMQKIDQTRDYYLFTYDAKNNLIYPEVLNAYLTGIARELSIQTTKEKIICIDHVRDLREWSYPFSIEKMVDETNQYKNIKYLFFDTYSNLGSWRLKKRHIYKMPKPKRRDLQDYIERLAIKKNVYKDVKKPNRYFNMLAAHGEIWGKRKGFDNSFDNSKRMFDDLVNVVKTQHKDINELTFVDVETGNF